MVWFEEVGTTKFESRLIQVLGIMTKNSTLYLQVSGKSVEASCSWVVANAGKEELVRATIIAMPP